MTGYVDKITMLYNFFNNYIRGEYDVILLRDKSKDRGKECLRLKTYDYVKKDFWDKVIADAGYSDYIEITKFNCDGPGEWSIVFKKIDDALLSLYKLTKFKK